MSRGFAYVAVILVFVLASCVNTLDDTVLLQINDTIAPQIAIEFPPDGSAYATAVVIGGRVSDMCTPETEGLVTSLEYELLSREVRDVVSIANGGVFSFHLSTAEYGGDVIIRVTATDWSGNRSSETLTMVDAGNDVPSFSALPGNRSVEVTWSDVALAESYTLYEHGSNLAIPNATSPWMVDGLTNGELCYLQLEAVVPEGENAWSEIIETFPLSTMTLVPSLTPGRRSIDVTWTDIPACSEYVLLKSLTWDGPYSILAITGQTSFTDAGLMKGIDYFYKVRPYDTNPLESEQAVCQLPFFPSIPSVLSNLDPGSYTKQVAVHGHYAYVATLWKLYLMDVSDPLHPATVHTFSEVDTARDVTVQGDYVYVTDWLSPEDTGALHIIDAATDPATIIKTVATDGVANAVDVSGSYAYVSDYYGGVRVVSILNPLDAAIVNTLEIPSPIDIAVAGSKAYAVSDDDHAVYIVDITDPETASGVEVVLDTPESAWDVCATDANLYVAVAGEGVQIYTIPVAATDSPVGAVDLDGSASSLVVGGDRAYVACGAAGLQILDVSDASSPSVEHVVPTLDSAVGVAVSGAYAYVADNEAGMQIVDVSSPLHPGYPPTQVAGTADTESVTVCGPFAVAACYEDGLRVLSTMGPGSPSVLSEVPMSSALDVAVSGSFAYVAGDAEFLVVSLADPGNAEVVHNYMLFSERAKRVELSGAFAYTTSYDGLRIFNIEDPLDPYQVRTVATSGITRDLAITGTHAFLASDEAGLQIIDIGDPDNAYLTHTVSPPAGYTFEAVASAGDHAYVLSRLWGSPTYLEVVDITNPATAELGSHVEIMSNPRQLTVDGTFVYVTGIAADPTNSALQVVDVSNPAAPVVGAEVLVPGYSFGVSIAGRYAWVANKSEGVQVYDLMPGGR